MQRESKLMHLHSSETVVVHSASRIFSAFVTGGKVNEQNEEQMIEKAIDLAIRIARRTDTLVMDDDEIKKKNEKLPF